ncbi:MAG: WbqC family protein, partial [Planctomycetota bacterium]
QPNYLPYPGFFQKIAAADLFLIVDTSQFVKRGPFGWIHRNRIRTPNGPIWLSLPVLHRGRFHQTIAEARLNPRVDWRRKHWRSLEWNYSRAPFWERYAPSLNEIYRQRWTHLAPLSTAIIRWFLRQLEIPVEVRLASDLLSRGRSTEYIVSVCKELGADSYLSGAHGRDYLEGDRFQETGIRLLFHRYRPPPPEAGGAVGGSDAGEAQLSMLDMLLWRGDAAVAWVHEGEAVARL